MDQPDYEPVYLHGSLVARLKAQNALIQRNTPSWAMRCRRERHYPAMLDREGRRWWCVQGCGDDRTDTERRRHQ
jgi:hypothetical protein